MTPENIADLLAERHEGGSERQAYIDEYDAWCQDKGYDPADTDSFDRWTFDEAVPS